jgi:DNA mismatch endonuclease (patch repair protein)
MMARVSGKDNRAEKDLRSQLWRMGFRFRLHDRNLMGRPDIVFPRYRVVVFVDGDFWHGRALVEGGRRQLRQVIRGKKFKWWAEKLERNALRDGEGNAALMAAGWKVMRVWESELSRQRMTAVRRIAGVLRSRSKNRERVGRSSSATKTDVRRM